MPVLVHDGGDLLSAQRARRREVDHLSREGDRKEEKAQGQGQRQGEGEVSTAARNGLEEAQAGV